MMEKHSRPQYKIKKWIIYPLRNNQIGVEGFRCDSEETDPWKSTAIVHRINQWTVQSNTGSLYKLSGRIDRTRGLEAGLSADVIRDFQNGFPLKWQEKVQRHFGINEKDRFHENQEYVTEPAEHFNSSLGSLQKLNLQSTRSGRKIIPPLAWWVGERLVSPHNSNGITHYVTLSPSLKPEQEKHLLPNDIFSRHQSLKRSLDDDKLLKHHTLIFSPNTEEEKSLYKAIKKKNNLTNKHLPSKSHKVQGIECKGHKKAYQNKHITKRFNEDSEHSETMVLNPSKADIIDSTLLKSLITTKSQKSQIVKKSVVSIAKEDITSDANHKTRDDKSQVLFENCLKDISHNSVSRSLQVKTKGVNSLGHIIDHSSDESTLPYDTHESTILYDVINDNEEDNTVKNTISANCSKEHLTSLSPCKHNLNKLVSSESNEEINKLAQNLGSVKKNVNCQNISKRKMVEFNPRINCKDILFNTCSTSSNKAVNQDLNCKLNKIKNSKKKLLTLNDGMSDVKISVENCIQPQKRKTLRNTSTRKKVEIKNNTTSKTGYESGLNILSSERKNEENINMVDISFEYKQIDHLINDSEDKVVSGKNPSVCKKSALKNKLQERNMHPVTASKGTIKRKKQLISYLSGLEKNHEDDIFNRTPRKVADLPNNNSCKPACTPPSGFFLIEPQLSWNSSFSGHAAETQNINTSLPYLYRRQQWRKNAEKQNACIKSIKNHGQAKSVPHQATVILSKPFSSNSKFPQNLYTHMSQQNEDCEEYEDVYFSDTENEVVYSNYDD